MSDFGDPNAPRPGAVPPPPPPYGAHTPYSAPGTPSPYGPQSAYGQQQYQAMRKPRPPVPVGAGLLLVGGAMAAIGSFVTWFSSSDVSVTGFTRAAGDDVRDGPFFLTFGLLMVAFGIALLSAKKVLAVTIISIIVGAVTVFAAAADLSDVSDLKDALDVFGSTIDIGPGLYLCLIGGLIGTAGGIVATAKRRR